MRKLGLLVLISSLSLWSCTTDANVADRNLTEAADNFEIYRRVVFYNGITNEYIMSLEGYCSIYDSNHQLEVIVKAKDGKYLKHHLGLSDNVTYFSEQLRPSDVDVDHYRITFKPSVIKPTVELR